MTADQNIIARILGPTDSAVLDRVANGVFDNEVNRSLAVEFLHDSRHHIAVAIDGDTVVGMVTAVHYVHPDKRAQLFINEVAVCPDYHRQGIASRLLVKILETGKRLGCTEAWVLTDEGNSAANALYAGHGGEKSDSVMYTFRF
jgi:ribosomal protein S18 acetylase RimI-like enzyme